MEIGQGPRGWVDVMKSTASLDRCSVNMEIGAKLKLLLHHALTAVRWVVVGSKEIDAEMDGSRLCHGIGVMIKLNRRNTVFGKLRWSNEALLPCIDLPVIKCFDDEEANQKKERN
jgi:hypothetical protein